MRRCTISTNVLDHPSSFPDTYASTRNRHGHDLVRPRVRPRESLFRPPSRRPTSRSTCFTRRTARVSSSSTSAPRTTRSSRETKWSRATSSRRTTTSILTPEELKALEEKATNTIDISEFVPLAKVDREYLDKTYYLGPDKGGDRAYRLLTAALDETGRAALGQYAARGQQHLVLLRPLNGVLVMEQLHYADELRPTTQVEVPEGDGEACGARISPSSSSSSRRATSSSPRSTRTPSANGSSRRSRRRSRARRSPRKRRRSAAARSSTSWKR